MAWVLAPFCCTRCWIIRCSSGRRWPPGSSWWPARCMRAAGPTWTVTMTYYEELGVSETASREEIRQAYKQLARVIHPDHCGDNPTRRLADLQLKRLNGILEMLLDPQGRA